MDATETMIDRLHEIATRERNSALAATCLIALGETDAYAAWSLPAPIRARLDAMKREDAVRQCMAVIESRGDIDQA